MDKIVRCMVSGVSVRSFRTYIYICTLSEDAGIFACCFVLGCLRSMVTAYAVLVVEVGLRGGLYGPSLD